MRYTDSSLFICQDFISSFYAEPFDCWCTDRCLASFFNAVSAYQLVNCSHGSIGAELVRMFKLDSSHASYLENIRTYY